MRFTKRNVVTLFASLAILCFLAVATSSSTTAGETVEVTVKDCSGSAESALLVTRWTPVRNLITQSKIRRTARIAARASCSAPQVVVTVRPVRLFRGCVNGNCR